MEMEQRMRHIEDELKDMKERLKKLESRLAPGSAVPTADKEFAEFLHEHDVVKRVDKVLCAGVFLTLFRSKLHFTKNDIDEQMRSMKARKLSNTTQFVNENVKKGFMAESGKTEGRSNCFHVTETGKRFMRDLKKNDSER